MSSREETQAETEESTAADLDGELKAGPASEADPFEKLKKDHEELKSKILYQAAEFENFKKRSHKEREDLLKFGNERLLEEFLPVVDNLERAIEAAKKTEGAHSVLEGVEMVLKQFMLTLEKFGVKPIEAQNKPFDPEFHEAVSQKPTEECEPNTVVEVFQAGYLLHGRLLRPARVVVSTRKQ